MTPVKDLDFKTLDELQGLGEQVLKEVSTNPSYAAQLLIRLHQEQDSLSQLGNIYRDLSKKSLTLTLLVQVIQIGNMLKKFYYILLHSNSQMIKKLYLKI